MKASVEIAPHLTASGIRMVVFVLGFGNAGWRLSPERALYQTSPN